MKRKLLIGGMRRVDGWEILNAIPGPNVDHLCNANDLSQFNDGTFSEIYASHVVEHLDYKDELVSTLKEWWRVMKPGGKVYISVPDLDILAELILSKDKLTVNERFYVMMMIFGGHLDDYDYHVVGLNEDFLKSYLREAGYENITRVEGFGITNDTSSMKYKDVAISLNMTAEKPGGYVPSSNISSNPEKVGRNELCPCGSGKKYKKCHGKFS